MTQSQKDLINRYLRQEWKSHQRSIQNAKANPDMDEEKLQSIIGWNEARKSDIIAVNAIIESLPLDEEKKDSNNDCPF